MKVVNIKGELLVANRPTSYVNTFYDAATGRFVKPTITTQDGVATWTFEQCDPPETFYDEKTQKSYFAALVLQDGVVTWTFQEAY